MAAQPLVKSVNKSNGGERPSPKKTEGTMTKVVALLAGILLLSACGIKGDLERPGGEKDDQKKAAIVLPSKS